MTLIPQKYHNERAIYLADHYNHRAIGYNAVLSHIRRNRIKNTLREYLDRPKMFLDINCRQEPDIKPIQASGVDLVEKEPQPRFIKINYGTRGAEYELKDTIVKPTYTKISKDTR